MVDIRNDPIDELGRPINSISELAQSPKSSLTTKVKEKKDGFYIAVSSRQYRTKRFSLDWRVLSIFVFQVLYIL